MEPIGAIADLPFRERAPREVLNLDGQRAEVDRDYEGYGWARVGALHLESRDGQRRLVRDALLVAVHTTESPEAIDGELELEFVVPEVAADYSVTVLLSAFLAKWLPRLPRDAGAVVLCVCNPRATALPRPPSVGAATLHYPMGDVESWLQVDPGQGHGGATICLVADAWCVAEPAHA